eukprot:TRINITY_DN14278_c0_g1_i3.p1 TRINITY_DN14278_c0_g1~~TRINITY_DN14278_c0_g1_i3.p1  ORF type:complete len:133 (+),score=36.70 TRINITY_DN14278_c0_g1_i3:165-563(+)
MEKTVLISKSRHGKLLRSVVEQYLRDDIVCGLHPCPLCNSKSGSIPIDNCEEIYIPDEEFLESQIDLVRFCPCVRNCICLQSVMRMLQLRNAAVYGEVKELIEGGHSGFYYFANENFRETFVVALAESVGWA